MRVIADDVSMITDRFTAAGHTSRTALREKGDHEVDAIAVSTSFWDVSAGTEGHGASRWSVIRTNQAHVPGPEP